MTLTLDVTGDTLADGFLGSLVLDEKNMLGMEYEGLRKIIAQVVRAINTMGKHVEKLRDDDDQLLDAVQNLEQQISSFEVRARECEDTCQEIRLQIGTLVIEQQKAPEPEPEVKSDVSRKDFNELAMKIDELTRDGDNDRKTQQNDVQVLHRKISEHEETLHKHQEFFSEELESRLTQSEDDRVAIKSDLEAFRQSLEDSNNRKASKMEVADVAHRLHTLISDHEADHQMLTDARKQFVKLDGLTDLVNDNQTRMQEMWAQFGKESQELRDWTSNGFSELRYSVRTKMAEEDALTHVRDIRRELRELAPFLSEAVSRVEKDVRNKAAATDVLKLQDGMEVLNRQTGRPKQLLLGTKCLACDRLVSTADATDRGPVCLANRHQEEELWNEVQRTLKNKADPLQKDAKDVLRYVAIHVGSPTRPGAMVGQGIFEGRDREAQNPGSHYLVRASGGAGAVISRPHTVPTVDSSERSPPREVPPLVRVPPRRPGRFASSGTPRTARLPNATVRAALGARSGQPAGAPAPPSTAPAAPSALAAEDGPDEAYDPLRQQPAAHSGRPQPQATDYDADDLGSYMSSGVLSPSRPAGGSRPASRNSIQ